VTPRDFARQFTGVFGFPVTPFHQDLSLDLSALERNVDEMAAHPFCAMVATGGTGELYSLTAEETEEVVRTAVGAAKGRMPIVAGTGYNAAMGVDIAKRAERAGAQCLLILPPYYSNAPEEGLFAYYEAIGKATGLPLMIYSRDWASFCPDQVSRLADRIPTLAAWKDGQGNGMRYGRIMQKLGDRLAWLGGLGDDCVPTYFAVGVQAYTSSISNISPKVSLALAKAGMARDFTTLTSLMNRYVNPLYALRERVKGYEVAVMKTAMEMMGKPAGPVRPPLENTRPQDRKDLEAIVETYRQFERE
jgi:5-dehydro-4-deoxyglucarate dehydratase